MPSRNAPADRRRRAAGVNPARSKPAKSNPPVVPDAAVGAGLLDTSVLVDFDLIDPAHLPDATAIAAVTLAELSAGPHATADVAERARRQDRLQWVSSTWEPMPFDAACARAYGRLYAAMRANGRSSRARLGDLLIAATAVANGLPVYTRNPADLEPLRPLVRVVAI